MIVKIRKFFLIFMVYYLSIPIVYSDALNTVSKFSTTTSTFFRLPYGEDKMQFGDLHLSGSGGLFPVVVTIHGGCWLSKFANLEMLTPLAAAITQLGIATWNIEYRSIDNVGGGWPGTFQDVAGAINYLAIIAEQYHLDLNNVIVLGHSAGGHLALWAAAQNKLAKTSEIDSPSLVNIQGVINLAGPGDLIAFYPLQESICGEKVITQLLGGTPAEKPNRYHDASPAELIPLNVKQVLITGESDTSVPATLAENYQQKAKQAGDDVELIVVKGVAHRDIVLPESAAWPYIKQEILSLLKLKNSENILSTKLQPNDQDELIDPIMFFIR